MRTITDVDVIISLQLLITRLNSWQFELNHEPEFHLEWLHCGVALTQVFSFESCMIHKKTLIMRKRRGIALHNPLS